MKTFEGFRNWFKDSEDDKIALRLLDKIKDIDPDSIWHDHVSHGYTGEDVFTIRDKQLDIEIRTGESDEHSLSWQCELSVIVNGNPLKCSRRIKKKIHNLVEDMYKEEKERKRIQELDTDIL